MKKSLLFLAIALLFINLIGGVYAVDIVYDDFESGSLSGWNLSNLGTAVNWTSSTTNPYQGTRHAQSQPLSTTEPASVMQRNISTLGYQNIIFRYYKRNIGLDIADEFQAEWYNGTGWTLVESTGASSSNDAAYVLRSYSLSVDANNNPNFAIKFECTAGATSEYCRIDNVNISGTAISSDNPPISNLSYPADNSNFTRGIVNFQCNASDDIGLKNITFYLWNFTNSLVITNFSSISGISNSTIFSYNFSYDNIYKWNCLVYDNISQDDWDVNRTINLSTPDTTPPYFTLIPNSTNITYGQGFGVDFDATDETSFGSYSINWTNYFSINQSGYLKNTTQLAAGIYNIKVSINDSSGNTNSTIYQVVVNKASQSIISLLNGLNSNLVVNYPQQVNASYSGVNSTAVIIKLNLTQINIAQNYTLAAGNYFLNYSVSENQNYTSYETYLNLTINKASPSVRLYLNGVRNNLTIVYGNPINASAYSDSTGVILYRDGIDVTSENGLNKILTAEYYNYTAYFTGNQNYTGGTETFFLNITKASQTAILNINETSPIIYGNYINVSCNGELFRNNINVTNEKGLSVLLGAGSYNYSCQLYENQNYTYDDDNLTFVVNKATPTLIFLANSGTSNLTLVYPQQVNISASSNGGTVSLDKDLINYLSNNGLNITLGAGSYIFRANITGNQNYFDIQYSYYNVTINKASTTTIPLVSPISPITYGTVSNFSCSNSADLNTILYINGIDKSSEKSLNIIRASGNYVASCNSSDNQNYSGSSQQTNYVINKATSTIEMLINGTAGNQTGYYGVQTNVSVVLGNSEQTIIIYKNGINDNSNLNVYQILGIGDYNFTAVAGLTQNYTLLTITRWSHILCKQNLQNTSWSNWINLGNCKIDDLQEQVRNRTQYDANNCGYVNTTIYEYQNVSCNYCTPNLLNTTKGDWYYIESCQPDDLRNRQRNWTQYDVNNCGEIGNVTYYENEDIACNFLTITCEVGGPYQQGALVLFIGNVTNSTNVLVGENVDINLYKNNILNLSRILQTSEDGDFETSFSNLSVGNYKINASASYLGANKTCSKNFEIGSAASLVLDKTASIHNISNNEIFYNISLRILNTGGSDSINLSLNDADYGFYQLGKISPGEIIGISYLMNFTRQNSTGYYLLQSTGISGIDSYSNSLISADSSSINLTIPSSSYSPGKQIVIIKNIVYSQETRLNVSYNVSVSLYNTGDEDLENINYIDSDFNSGILLNLSRGDSKAFSNLVVIDKAASNIQHEFALGSITINSLVFYSNRPKINIPGYGGPADLYVYAPASVNSRSSFDSIIEILNMNLDIGQDFIIDYWITNNDESMNYSSGQKTVYVSASGNVNISVTLTSPLNQGVYRLMAIVSWAVGTANAFDSFEVVSEQIIIPPDGGSGGGGGGGGGRAIANETNKTKENNESKETGEETNKTNKLNNEIICNPPYIRYGKECCLDENNNKKCDADEPRKGITGLFVRDNGEFYFNYSLFGLLFLLPIIIFIIYRLIRRLLLIKKIKNKGLMRIKDLIKLKVYTEEGIKIGKIIDIILKENKIDSLKIKFIRKIYKKLKRKGIILSYKHVKTAGEIVIIDERVSDII